jgi:hypothetical protein
MGGNIALAGDLLGENVRTNGVRAGVAKPKRRIQERLAGFRDLATTIEDMFSVCDKSERALFGAEPIPAHIGASTPAASRRRSATLPGGASKTARSGEILTIQDRLAQLRQIGYLPRTGLSGLSGLSGLVGTHRPNAAERHR